MRSTVIIFYSIANYEPLLTRGLALTTPGQGLLHLIFILEEKLPRALSSVMAHIGFLGEGIKADMETSIINNYNNQVKTIIQEAYQRAASSGIAVNHELITNNIFSNCLQIIKDNLAEYVIINYTNNDSFNQLKDHADLQLLMANLDVKQELYIEGVRELIE
jgi:hypothetical protein